MGPLSLRASKGMLPVALYYGWWFVLAGSGLELVIGAVFL